MNKVYQKFEQPGFVYVKTFTLRHW